MLNNEISDLISGGARNQKTTTANIAWSFSVTLYMFLYSTFATFALSYNYNYYRRTSDIMLSKVVKFNLFHSRTPGCIFSSTLYTQCCWCLIQVIHIP